MFRLNYVCIILTLQIDHWLFLFVFTSHACKSFGAKPSFQFDLFKDVFLDHMNC